MKLSELHEENMPAEDGFDPMQVADDNDDSAAGHGARDIAHKEKLKILKVGRGDNFKKAKSIAANAKADARAVDAENEDTPHVTGGNIPFNNMRLT